MRKNKIIVVTIIAVCVTIILIILNHTLRKNTDQALSDESYHAQLQKSELANGWKNITNEDMKKFLAPERDFNEQKVKERFTGSVVNRDTLQFFQFMDDLFKDANDIANHLDKARKYLYSVLPPGKAGQMFELYKTYVNDQVDRLTRMKEWSITGASQEALDNLARIREHRRAVFGKENADIIFGVSEKADEYDIRRRMILADANMYGLEKERKLRILNEMMWGSETMPFDENLTSYARYQEKLNLYSRDLSDTQSAAEKQATLDKLRRETFSPEELQRMEEAKRSSDEEAKVKEQYTAREKEIANSNLDSETKDSRIRDLQDETFGAEAESFRRQQAILKGLEEARKKAALEAQEARSRPQHRSPEEALEELNKKVLEQQREARQQEASE